jgi:hypothetical protein
MKCFLCFVNVALAVAIHIQQGQEDVCEVAQNVGSNAEIVPSARPTFGGIARKSRKAPVAYANGSHYMLFKQSFLNGLICGSTLQA